MDRQVNHLQVHFILKYRLDHVCTLIGKKNPCFIRGITLEKACFIVFRTLHLVNIFVRDGVKHFLEEIRDEVR